MVRRSIGSIDSPSSMLGHDFGLTDGKFVAFATHHLDQNGQLQFAAPHHLERVRAVGIFDAKRDVRQKLFLETVAQVARSDVLPFASGERGSVYHEVDRDGRLVDRDPRGEPACSMSVTVSPMSTASSPATATISPARARARPCAPAPRTSLDVPRLLRRLHRVARQPRHHVPTCTVPRSILPMPKRPRYGEWSRVAISIWKGPSAMTGGDGTCLIMVSNNGDRYAGVTSVSVVAAPSRAAHRPGDSVVPLRHRAR